MNIKQRISFALSALLGRVALNRYEGATQSWGERSLLNAGVQDAKYDADQSSRLELVRRSRYWERNNAIVNRLADVFEQYTVGPSGLQVIPNHPTDTDWNNSASHWWADWGKFPDVASALPLGVVQSVMARTWFVDGEVFIYKTFSPESGRPRIQLIEGHRIGTPPSMRAMEGKSIVDGIEFATDANQQPIGRPQRYWYRTDSNPAYGSPYYQLGQPGSNAQAWDYIDGERMLHLFEPNRPGMFRGLPFLYPVMNDLHDLDDLQQLEMKCAKSNAEVANVVTNKTGEATNLVNARRQKWSINSQNAAGQPTTKEAPLFYEMTVGGRTVYVSNGEKFEQFKSDRPGAAQQMYWDYLVRKICAGVGISSLLVMPFSLQGTVTRADMDVSNMFFRARSAVLAAIMREIYLWSMSWAVKFDRRLDGAPRDWWHVNVRPPRSATADVGRNSQAVLEELEAGTRTFQDVCAELGHDWRHVLRQKAVEAKFISDLADEFDVTREQISQLAKGTFSVKETVAPTGKELDEMQPGADDDSDDAKKKKPAPAESHLYQPLNVTVENTAPSAPSTTKRFKITRDEKGNMTSAEIETVPVSK